MHNMLLLSENVIFHYNYLILVQSYRGYLHCLTDYILKTLFIWQWGHLNKDNPQNIATIYLYLEIEELMAFGFIRQTKIHEVTRKHTINCVGLKVVTILGKPLVVDESIQVYIVATLQSHCKPRSHVLFCISPTFSSCLCMKCIMYLYAMHHCF